MSFQPLDPELTIDPFNTASLTGLDARTGIYLDADQTNSSVLIETNNTAAMYIDKFQNMGINTLSPSAQLDINSSSGSCIQLTYNGSATNKANMKVTSDGKLVLMAGGTEVNVDTTSNFNVKSHNGTNAGLMLGNALVLSNADQLNFNVVTPGAAASSKALVLNSSGSIAGITSLSATSLLGTIDTADQPNIRTLSVVDIVDHTGAAGLSLGGVLVTSTAEKLNYVDTTPGTAAAGKALILDGSRNLSNINALTAAQLTGTLQTAAQPNITSLGTLTSLNMNGSLSGLTDLSINTTETGRTLVINHPSGNCFRMYYDSNTSAANYTDLLVDGSGNLMLTTSGGNVDITSHDGASQGLRLGSVLVTATADQLNYLQGTTPGNVAPGKAMIIDSNRNIGNVNSLSAVSLTGTLLTAAQPNIASVNELNIATHNGATLGLKLNGALVTATAGELNYVDTAPGAAEAMKALVLDGNMDISGINALSAAALTGTLQTAAQPNITSVGVLDSIQTAGPITIGTTNLSESELAVVDEVVPGTAAAGKALVLDTNLNISGVNALTATELTGTIQTASQPNIRSVSTLNITDADGLTTGLELAGALVTATATELNYVDTAPGVAAASKALILDANKDISGINALTASDITGTLQTAAQPNITSVGTLSSLAIAGDLTMGTTTLDEAEVAVLDGVVPGTVSASKALVVDADKNISTINTLTATSLVGTDLTGTLQTGAQPNITSVTTLDITGADGTTAGLKLGGVLLTATAEQINSIFGAGGQGTFQNLTVNDSLTLANADGVSKGLVLGSALVTADGAELNYLDGAMPGVVVESKAVVVDENKDISSFRNLTALNLTGTLQTAAQPNITSVGTLTSIATSGTLTVGNAVINEAELGVLDAVVPGSGAAGKALVLDNDKGISGISYLATSALTLLPSSLTYGEQWTVANSGSYPFAGVRGLFVYSPTLNLALVFRESNIDSVTQYAIMDTITGYSPTRGTMPLNGSRYLRAAVWNPITNKFVIALGGNPAFADSSFAIFESSNGTSWTQISTISSVLHGTNFVFHQPSGHIVFASRNRFYHSADGGVNWQSLAFTSSGGPALGASGLGPVALNSIIDINSYVMTNTNEIGNPVFFQWSNSQWTATTVTGTLTNFRDIRKAYHVSEDRLYISAANATNGQTIRIFMIDDVSTKTPNEIISSMPTTPDNMNNEILNGENNALLAQLYYVPNYGVFGWAGAFVASESSDRRHRFILHRFNDKTLTNTQRFFGSATMSATINHFPLLWSDDTVLFPSSDSSSPYSSIYSIPSGVSSGILFGSTLISEEELSVVNDIVVGTASASKALVLDSGRNISNIAALSASTLAGTIQTAAQPNITSLGTLTSLTTSGALTLGTTSINESEIAVLDTVVPGTVSPSKAVVVDANRDIASFNNLTATNLTGTIQTAAQPNIASVNALDITTHNGVDAGLRLAGSLLTSTATELNYLDGSVPGVVVPASAVVVDGNKDISSFRNLTSVTLTSTAGSLTMGATTIDETEIAVIDAVVPGAASAMKALVLDTEKDISGIHSLSAQLLTSTDGSLTMGLTNISESEIGVLDAVVPGVASASKALVVDASKAISEIGSVSAGSLTSTDGSLTMGATSISESEIGVLDAVVAGVVSPSKAVVVDENKDVSAFRNLVAENLTGTLQTAAQPNITSVGTLSALNVADDITAGGDVIIAGTTLTSVNAAYLAGATPGTSLPTTALVVDENKDISEIRTLTATNLIGTNLTGTIQTAAQPNISSVNVLDITAHDGETQGLRLGGVLLTTTAAQINSIFNEGGEGTFENLTVNDTLTLANADGTSMGLKLGSTLVTATGTELNYVDTTPGVAQPLKALVFDENINISGINALTASALTGTIQTAAQPNISSVTALDITSHDGATQGLRLGGVLLTATATQINSIFGAGGEGTFNNLTVNDTLTLANADGVEMGLVLGETLLTASGVELNYLDGSVPGTASAGNALVLDASRNITNINSLSALELTGTLQTAAQPNITSVGTLTALSVAGTVTVGETTLSENEVAVLDAVVPGTVAASKAVVVDANKDIESFRNLTALNLIATAVTGTLQTAAQPNITSVGELTSLDVAGDVNVGGNLNVGGTFISESEIVALDQAIPGTATATKAMVTDSNNSIAGVNEFSASTLTGTLQTAAQPNITSVGELTALDVAGDVSIGGNLNVGGTFISEAEIIALDAAVPGSASAQKAMITDENNSIDSINSLSAVSLSGTIQTAAQPNISSVNALDITTHDGATVGLSLGGSLITASATELNYVDTTAGAAQASKALVLDADKNIAGISTLSTVNVVSQTGTIESTVNSTSPTTGALTIAGGVGIAQSLQVGGDVVVAGELSLQDSVSVLNEDDSTSAQTGSITTAGGVGIAKSLFVAGNSTVVGNVSITGSSTQSGTYTITNATESTSASNGSIITNGGVGIAKSLNVGVDASVGGDLLVSGTTQLTSDVSLLSTVDSTSAATGSFVSAGGVGIAKSLNVGENVSVSGALAVIGNTTQTGLVSVVNETDSTSISTGSVVTAGGAGIAKNLNVGGLTRLTDLTASTDPTTGALVVAGGAGVGGSLNVGGDVFVDGDVNMAGNMVLEGGFTSSRVVLTQDPASASNFEIKATSEYVMNESGEGYQWNNESTSTDDGVQLMKLDSAGLLVNTTGQVADTTDSVSPSTGALTVLGGVGIAKNLNVGANTALTGTLAVGGASTLTGAVSVVNDTESDSVSTGSIITAGGVGIAKSLNVGGDVDVLGASAFTGSVSVINVAESTSTTAGALVVSGGVGIAKSLRVGVDAYVAGALEITGASSLIGNVSVGSETESTSISTGAVVVAGGVGIAKSLHVGIDADIEGALEVAGAASIEGVVSVVNDTESTNITNGSLVAAGGVGITKNLNVGGTATVANATPSTSATTGALVVSGGVGISSDLNIGGDIGIAGDLNLIGDFNLSGRLNTTNVSLVPDAASPFSTLPLTTITREDSLLALNKDTGIGYINSAAATVVVPELLTTSSVVYYATNSTSDWSVLGLRGSALTTYNSTYSGFGIRVRQLYVNSFSGKIWLAGAFFSGTSSIGIVLCGSIEDGIDTLYTVGSMNVESGNVECRRLAVATDDNNVVVVNFNGFVSELHRMNIASSPSFSLVLQDDFVSVAWLNGLGKFVATRNGTSSMYTSADSTAAVWVDANTPSLIAANTVYFNTTINLAVAVGPNYLWYSTNAAAWTEATYQPLASGNTFNAVVNSPVSRLLAIYSNSQNSVAQLYYSVDAINWITITLSGPTFGFQVPLTTSVAFSPSNFVFTVSRIDNVDTIQRVGPITSASMIYGVGVTSGYLKSESAIGYEWYNNSTPTDIGDEIMRLTSDGLVVRPIVDVENDTNSLSPTSGSIVTTGGAGIAKNLNVGMDLSVGGAMTISGEFNQNGQLNVNNSTDSVSPSTGAITTTGGVGIAKALNVGTSATVGGALSIGGSSSLIGSVSIANTLESLSPEVGSLTTAGGVGIAKSLSVGINASIAGDMTVEGTTNQVGVLTVSNVSDSSSASTGSITTTGGVGIAKNLNVGVNARVGGTFEVISSSAFTGLVSLNNLTESTSAMDGALRVAGGAGIAKSLFVGINASVNGTLSVGGATSLGGDVSLLSTTDSVSPSTGSLVLAGGLGVDKALHVGTSATVGGALTVGGISTLTDATDATSVTTGSFKTAGGVGIAKSLHVGTGIYGTIETAAQPNISSVNVLNITGANGADAGLSLAGVLITADSTELNYLDGSVQGLAIAGKALVVDVNRNISDINALSAAQLTGTIQTASQPLITSVATLNITNHDGLETGLSLGGTLLRATADELNSLVAGTSAATFTNATVLNNLTLSGADGSTIGLIIGTTLVTASGAELNYVDTTAGTAEASKALILDADRNITNINALTASQLSGTIQTAAQPLITSVTTLDITGHNGSSVGLSLGGVLITSTAEELNYLDTTAGSAQASKALVLDADRNITGISSLSATNLVGTLQTAAQPNITSVGQLTSLAVAGDITIGSTVLSEADLFKIDDITNGTAAAGKALVLDANQNISGINSLSSSVLAVGAPLNSDLPLEVGFTQYIFTGGYAYMNEQNAHGIIEAGMGVSANYSLRTDGRILCTGEIEITSDRRMKKNIIELSPEFSKKFIMTTTPVKFNWKTGDDIADYGYIAQDVLKAGFTDLVTVTPQPGMEGSVEEDGFINPQDAKFVFSPGKIVPMLALNQRDLYEQLQEKDSKIADLESRIAKLEAMFAKMQ